MVFGPDVAAAGPAAAQKFGAGGALGRGAAVGGAVPRVAARRAALGAERWAPSGGSGPAGLDGPAGVAVGVTVRAHGHVVVCDAGNRRVAIYL